MLYYLGLLTPIHLSCSHETNFRPRSPTSSLPSAPCKGTKTFPPNSRGGTPLRAPRPPAMGGGRCLVLRFQETADMTTDISSNGLRSLLEVSFSRSRLSLIALPNSVTFKNSTCDVFLSCVIFCNFLFYFTSSSHDIFLASRFFVMSLHDKFLILLIKAYYARWINRTYYLAFSPLQCLLQVTVFPAFL